MKLHECLESPHARMSEKNEHQEEPEEDPDRCAIWNRKSFR